MTTNYSAVTFPQATAGYNWGPSSNPDHINYMASLSSTQTINGALYPSTWNPQSATNVDRTAYVLDTAGTLSLEQAQTNCFGVPHFQLAQISTVTQGFDETIGSIPVTVNGVNYQLDNSTPIAMANNLQLATSAFMVSSQAPVWASGMTVTSGAYCNLGGVYLFCSTGGKTGSTAPTAPTTFGTPVPDGTAAWELLGRHINLTGGTTVMMTPQEIMSAAAQGELYLHVQKNQLINLTAQINAATTVSSVQAVVW